MKDQALDRAIRAAQAGDAAGLERLVDGFADRVFGFLFRMTGNRPDAEDLTQEVFVRLVRKIGAYRHDGKFEPWLFRIAANLARDRVRGARRSPPIVSSARSGEGETREDDAAACEDAVDAGLMHQEEMDALSAALQKLPDAEREVVMLRHFSQMSFNEIARLTGVPLGTALARGHRGLARLRSIMNPAMEREDRLQPR